MKLEQLQEAKYAAPPVEFQKLERLLHAVVKVIPFIGYEARVENIKDELDDAFQEVTGMSWVAWKNQ